MTYIYVSGHIAKNLVVVHDVYIRQWSHSQKSSGSSKDPFMTYIYVSGTQRVNAFIECLAFYLTFVAIS